MGQDLDDLRARLRVKHQWDDDDDPPVLITICRGYDNCGEGSCDNCYKFWSDDKRTSEEIERDMDRMN